MVHDLYSEEIDTMRELKTQKDDALIGYSYGGRLALEIAINNDFNLSQVILISSHPGLEADERVEKRMWEDSIIEKMNTLPVSDFISFWDQLDLFNSSKIDGWLTQEKLLRSAKLLESFRPSQSNFQGPLLSINRHKITWVVGNKDLKYKKIMKDKIVPLEIEVVTVQSDHRALKAVSEIRELFHRKGIN